MIFSVTKQTSVPLVVKAEPFHAMIFLWSEASAYLSLTIPEAEKLLADLAPAIEQAKRIEAAAQAAA